MASRWRRAVSVVLGAMLVSASLAAMPILPAQATPTSSQASSCLVINAQDELVSANGCTGEVVVPASVKILKTRAFFNFKGAVSFEADSQLQSLEEFAFFGGTGLKSIVFPQSLQSLGMFAVHSMGAATVYFEGNPAQVAQAAVWQNSSYTIVQPRGAPLLPTGQRFTSQKPFQIDCNSIDGERGYLGQTFVALELHNCADPRNTTAANPPSTMGYVLNRDLNETVDLQSVDGSHRGSVRLHQLGYNGHRLSVVQDLAATNFSTSAFGDQYQRPRGVQLTCALNNSTPLPAGVSLDSNCDLVSPNTTSLASSTTDITINWTASNGVSNSFDVSSASATSTPVLPVELAPIQGSVGIRVSLRKTSQLTAAQLFQMQLLTAKFSGTIRDWNLTIAAYRALPPDQVPAGAPDAGIAATTALEGFESGIITESAATSAIIAFANQAAPSSTYLQSLRDRLAVKAAANLVSAFEGNGLRPQFIRQTILDLPSSNARDALLSRFTVKTDQLFVESSTISGGSRTLRFTNPYKAETFTVPAGVTELTIELQGAEGSQGGFDMANRAERAGYKGRVSGRLVVSPGQVLTIGVGEAAGAAPSACLPGKQTNGEDSTIARGGTNPLGGYSGGNGGTPGTSNCSGYGGAGGAASVVRVGSIGNQSGNATLVAGGSAGSAGASDSVNGPIGLASFTARSDTLSTNGQAPQGLTWYSYWEYPNEPDDGGGPAGGGGGAIGGATGGYDIALTCGARDFCPSASSPGQNSTAGLTGLSASYVRYTFDDLMNASGTVTISFVEPPVTVNPGGSGGSGGGTASPTPTPTGAPTPGVTTSDAPADIKAVPFWKGADVSWKAPDRDGGSPITGYEVTASTGQICVTDKLTCRLIGLKPGQLLQLTVKAQNAIGFSAPDKLQGAKVFIPLSINLWQVKPFSGAPKTKLLNPVQLRTLRAMLIQDTGGFTLTVRLAANSSKLSTAKMRTLLVDETKAIKGQLRSAGLLGKVTIVSAIMPPNSKAKRPSIILVARKP
jgi:hypothetical protein